MRRSERRRRQSTVNYQSIVLVVSALVIVLASYAGIHWFQSLVAPADSVALGVTAAGQVVGTTGQSPASIPGIAGTATPTATPTLTPTPTTIPTATLTPTLTPTATPDVSFYDPARAQTLLAQAQTTWSNETPAFLANVTLAAERLNGQKIPPGTTFSFNGILAPYSTANGYQGLSATDVNVPTVEGGFTQVSSTLFQAVFWSGLKIVDRRTDPYWLDRYKAGSTGQRGLDAYVAAGQTDDLRFENNSGDWLRLEASVKPGSLTISIYGSDPGWSVNPSISAPSKITQPTPAQVTKTDPSIGAGQQVTSAAAIEGFDVTVQRTVTHAGQVVDRYGVAEHYQAQPAVVLVGPTPTPQPSPTPTPTAVTSASGGPTHLAGLNPAEFVLPDGRIRVPLLVGLPESEAQSVIQAVGLSTTFVNYQGPGDIPDSALNAVSPGQVLSQTPVAGTAVQRGTTIYIAVRRS